METLITVPSLARLRAARSVVLLDGARLCKLHQQWWFRQAQAETLVLMDGGSWWCPGAGLG